MTPLDHRISQAQTDLITLTQELIRIPTVNPPGPDYAAVCDVICAKFLHCDEAEQQEKAGM